MSPEFQENIERYFVENIKVNLLLRMRQFQENIELYFVEIIKVNSSTVHASVPGEH